MQKHLVWMREKRYFLRLLCIVVAVTVLPMLALGVLSYSYISHTVARQVEAQSSSQVRQTALSLNTMMEQIRSSFLQFNARDNIMLYSNYSLGGYYEYIDISTASEEDVVRYYDYIMSKQETIAGMRLLKSFNGYILNVLYVDKRKDMILEDSWAQYRIGKYSDAEVLETAGFTHGLYDSYVIGPRMLSVGGAGSRRVLTIGFKLNSHTQIILNIDFKALMDTMVGKLGAGQPYMVAAMDDTGEIVYGGAGLAAAGYALPAAEVWQRVQAGEAAFRLEGAGLNLFCVAERMDNLNCTLLGFYDLGTLLEGVHNVQRIVYTAIPVMLLVLAVVIIITSRSLYSPVKSLTHFLASGERHKGAKDGEFVAIYNKIENLTLEQDELTRRLNESFPVHRERFFSAFIESRRPPAEDLQEKLDYFRIGLAGRQSVMLVFTAEALADGQAAAGSAGVAYVALESILRTLFTNRREFLCAQTGDGYIAVALECTAQDYGEISGLAERIARKLETQTGLLYYVGISRLTAHFQDLPLAYREGVQALKFRSVTADCLAVHIEDAPADAARKAPPLGGRLEALYTHITRGDTEAAVALYHRILGELGQSAEQVYAEDVFNYIWGMYHGILERTLPGDRMEMEQHSGTDLFRLYHSQGINQLVIRFEEHVRLLSGYYAGRQAGGDTLVSRALAMMDTADVRELSLEQLAAALRVTPQYLSRIFHKVMGVKFIDHVTRLRMEKAKTLLAETGLQVQQVAQAVGYYKIPHFTKLFKESAGVTPAEYRRLHSRAGPEARQE